jgi:hypothetical protein
VIAAGGRIELEQGVEHATRLERAADLHVFELEVNAWVHVTVHQGHWQHRGMADVGGNPLPRRHEGFEGNRVRHKTT